MINLIGPDKKKRFHAARRNTIWRRYIFVLIGVLIVNTVVLAGATWVLFAQASASQQQVADNEAKRDAEYNRVKKEAEDFRAKLSTAKTILDGETSYSEVLIKMAQIIPAGSVLTGINLSENSFATDQTLTFKSKTNNDVLSLKTALEGSDLFSNVSISNTSEDVTSEDRPAYPVTVTINAKIIKPTSAAPATNGAQTP